MGDGNVVMHVRFKITNIGAGVTGSALLEALTTQLALDEVALVWGSLKRVEDGTQEADIDLPDVEADLLRGPMTQARIHVGRPMVVHFHEVYEDDFAPYVSNGASDVSNGYGVASPDALAGASHLGGRELAPPSQDSTPPLRERDPLAPRGWRDLISDSGRVQPNGLLAQSQQPIHSGRQTPIDPYLGEPYPRDAYAPSSRNSSFRSEDYTPPSSARHYIVRPVKQSSCCSRWVAQPKRQDDDPSTGRHRDDRYHKQDDRYDENEQKEQGGCVMQ